MQTITRGLFVGGLALLLSAGWLWLGERQGPAVVLSTTDLDLGELPVATQARVALTFENRGRGRARVVGLESC